MPKITFSVQVYQDNRWMIDAEMDSETAALKYAESLVTAAEHSGVKVTRERTRADGTISEQEIFNKTVQTKQKKLSIKGIDDANDCKNDIDFYNLQSRITIGRLLRNFLDELCITPTELLHNYRIIKKFIELDI
ncbi:MAG: hypothetical protein HQL37_13290, partial [Alphaproteobacteria bacterium]|nr:hypothetical protein [Alphaproteobacteria bacterium]